MAKALSPEAIAVRKKFLKDFEFWAKHCVTIRTKEGQHTPLVLNAAQKAFLSALIDQWRSTGRVRMICLKARQQGFSTFISAFQYWWLSQHKAHKGLVMAHEAKSTDNLFGMYARIHEHMPALLKPKTKYSSKTELVFADMDTGIRVFTAGGKGVARGDTFQFAHLSEVAFWPTAFAASNFNGLIAAVPSVDDTFVFVESTAQGMTGPFREIWVEAVQGRNGFLPFFSPWYQTPEYRTKAPKGFKRTPEEEKLAKEYSLDNEQLAWRREIVSLNGLDYFRQEYPAIADEAFLSTGRPVFNPEWIAERLRQPKQPIERMAITEGKVEPHPVGELLVYHKLDNAETYVVGADVGMGVRNGDFSVAQVLDSKLRQVAVWRGLVHPDYFAKVLTTLGYYYNSAMIAPERNNHGLLTCVRLRDDGYPYIYTDVTEGALEQKDTIQIGHFTSERTKPLIVDKLRAVDRDREIEINDETTLREMLTFVVTESGRMEAEQGSHDDCVMALAIANHIHEGKYTPVPVTDEYYVQAI